MQVDVDDVEAHVAGPRAPEDRVQVRPVVVERRPDAREILPHPRCRRRRGRAPTGRGASEWRCGRCLARRSSTSRRPRRRGDLHQLVARHGHPRRVRPVGGVGGDDRVALVSLADVLEVRPHQHQTRQLALGAGGRTVEEKVASIKKVKLINMDQIAEIVEKNIRSRKNEIQSAEKIIDTEMKSVDTMLKRKRVEPMVISIFKKVDEIREHELKKAFYILRDKVGPGEAKVVEQLSYAIVEGVLSAPMNNLRKEIEMGITDQEEIMKIIAKLFRYEDKES